MKTFPSKDSSRQRRPPFKPSKLRKTGALWHPKRPAGAHCLYSGSFTIHGWTQRFVVCRNVSKLKETEPDFYCLTSDDPTPATFTPGGAK